MNHTDTSAAALIAIKPTAPIVREMVLAALREAGEDGLTADECAVFIDTDRLNVRPRTTELRSQGKIADSGLRRLNDSGKRAIVWRIN